ncbi:MAG: hypothetical protein KDJ41_03455 [Hyphomicrobiaceae bacterium]|nr:hypothetical protein [Hyphomicrobiaceae bacterium]
MTARAIQGGIVAAVLIIAASVTPALSQSITIEGKDSIMGGIQKSKERMDEVRRREAEQLERRMEAYRREEDTKRRTGTIKFICTVKCSGQFGASRGRPTKITTYSSDNYQASKSVEGQAKAYCSGMPFYNPKSTLFTPHARAGAFVSCERG